MNVGRLPHLIACLWLSSALTAVAAPVAIVEDVSGRSPGIESMDYLEAGRVIRLNDLTWVVLSYFNSCVREMITGGTITVGTHQSEVQHGRVERTKVACDPGSLQLTPAQASGSAGMVFRSASKRDGHSPQPPAPQVTVYGLSPVFEIKSDKAPAAELVIEQIVPPGDRHVVKLRQEQLLRGAFYDLAAHRTTLTAGAVYRAVAGSGEVVFKIDPGAKPGQTPVVGRLLRLLSEF